MKNETEIIITPNGMFHRHVTHRPLDLNAGILNQLSSTAVRKVFSVLPGSVLKDGPSRPLNAAFGPTHSFWSIEIDKLRIQSAFATVENGGMVYPAFTEHKLPFLDLSWNVPLNMRLVLGIMLGSSNDLIAQYLVAYDTSGRMYQLPLSNLYDDCKLCSGKYGHASSSTLEAVTSAWEQFIASRWQGDLYQSGKSVLTKSLFGFKTTKTGFDQMFPSDGTLDWTKFATKIANEALSTNVVNHVSKI